MAPLVGCLRIFRSSGSRDINHVHGGGRRRTQGHSQRQLRGVVVVAASRLSSKLSSKRRLSSDHGESFTMVTGAHGFIGSHVAEILVKAGHNVLAIDNASEYPSTSKVEKSIDLYASRRRAISERAIKQASHAENAGQLVVKFVDVGNVDDLQKAMNDLPDDGVVDRVVHAAARAGVSDSVKDPVECMRVNVVGLASMLKAAQNMHVSRFVFLSSSSVYGDESGGGGTSIEDAVPTTEDFPKGQPLSPYAVSKLAGEQLVDVAQSLHPECSYHIVRPFTVYGPRGRADMAPLRFIHAALNDETVQLYGGGRGYRDFTHVRDVVRVVVACLNQDDDDADFDPKAGARCYNAGSGAPTSVADFAVAVGEACGTGLRTECVGDRVGDVVGTCASIDRRERELGVTGSVSLLDGLKETAAWYQDEVLNEAM
ncbi:UDP-glucuronate 4-epimerase 3 [Pycnococcus provasolii]